MASVSPLPLECDLPAEPLAVGQEIAAIEHLVSDDDTLVEGLHVFDPGALAPSCSTFTLRLSSEKDPNKADTVVVDTKVIEQIWQDFAAYRR